MPAQEWASMRSHGVVRPDQQGWDMVDYVGYDVEELVRDLE